MLRRKKLRVHVGCGAVYLEGYENVDVPLGEFYYAKDRPDLLEENKTTIDNYYKNPYYNNYYERFKLKLNGAKNIPPARGAPAKLKNRKKTVLDKTGFANDLPYKKNSVDEIRSVQVFEHLTPQEAEQTLLYWKALLKPRGKVVIDVPDIIETGQLLVMAQTEEEKNWAEKLIYGNRNDNFAYHKVGYWPEKLKKMLKRAGFTKIRVGENIHNYPAFWVQAVKP